MLWLTVTVVFADRLKKLWKHVATKSLTAAVAAAATLAVQPDADQTLVVQPIRPLQLLSSQHRLLKLLQLQLLQQNLRPSSHLACTISRRARLVWLVCSEWLDN